MLGIVLGAIVVGSWTWLMKQLQPTTEGRLAVILKYQKVWLRICRRMMGIRVSLKGAVPQGAVFLAPNHVGYADIVGLCSEYSVFSVTRSELRDMAGVGLILKLTELPYVARVQNRDLKTASATIVDRLNRGFPVMAFLEGTSTGGDRILPLKAPLVQAAIDGGAPVVPLAVKWKATRPGTTVPDDLAYWKKVQNLGPHVVRLCGLGGFEVEYEFGTPIDVTGMDRKQLTARIREQLLALTGLPEGDIPEGHEVWKPARE